MEIYIQSMQDLFVNGTTRWNIDLVEQLMRLEDILEILKIQLTHIPFKDLIGWHYTSVGVSTV